MTELSYFFKFGKSWVFKSERLKHHDILLTNINDLKIVDKEILAQALERLAIIINDIEVATMRELLKILIKKKDNGFVIELVFK